METGMTFSPEFIYNMDYYAMANFWENQTEPDSQQGPEKVSLFVYRGEVVLLILEIVCILTGVAGNAWLVRMIYREDRHYSVVENSVLMSVCVANLLSVLLAVPANFGVVLNTSRDVEENLSVYLCKGTSYLVSTGQSVVILSLVVLVLEIAYGRYLPGDSLFCGRTVFVISFIWFFSTACNIWEVLINTALIVEYSPSLAVRRCVFDVRSKYPAPYPGIKIASKTLELACAFLFPCIVSLIALLVSYKCRSKKARSRQRRHVYQENIAKLAYNKVQAMLALGLICFLPYAAFGLYSFARGSEDAFSSEMTSTSRALLTLHFMYAPVFACLVLVDSPCTEPVPRAGIETGFELSRVEEDAGSAGEGQGQVVAAAAAAGHEEIQLAEIPTLAEVKVIIHKASDSEDEEDDVDDGEVIDPATHTFV